MLGLSENGTGRRRRVRPEERLHGRSSGSSRATPTATNLSDSLLYAAKSATCHAVCQSGARATIGCGSGPTIAVGTTSRTESGFQRRPEAQRRASAFWRLGNAGMAGRHAMSSAVWRRAFQNGLHFQPAKTPGASASRTAEPGVRRRGRLSGGLLQPAADGETTAVVSPDPRHGDPPAATRSGICAGRAATSQLLAPRTSQGVSHGNASIAQSSYSSSSRAFIAARDHTPTRRLASSASAGPTSRSPIPTSVVMIVNRDSNDIGVHGHQDQQDDRQRFLGNNVNPHMVMMSPDGRYVVTGGTRANKAYIIDTRTLQLVKTIPVGYRAGASGVFAGRPLVLPGQPGRRLDLGHRHAVAEQDQDDSRASSSRSTSRSLPDGSKAYVGNYGAHWVGVIDVRRHELLKKIQVARGARRRQARPGQVSRRDQGHQHRRAVATTAAISTRPTATSASSASSTRAKTR